MYQHTNVAPSSRSTECPPPPSTTSNSARDEHQAREVSLSEIALASHSVSSSGVLEAITIKDHAVPLTLAPSPAIFPTETESSSSISRLRSNYSPGLLVLGISSAPSAVDNEVGSSSTAGSGAGSTTKPSISIHTSETAAIQTSTTSPIDIGSSRTTGIIIGSVLGGVAVLLIVILAFIYVAWRRRRRRRDQTDRGEDTVQQKSDKPTSVKGNNSNTNEERKRSIESPMTLPLQGARTPRPRTLHSEPIIVDISPITPIMPHLSRWTSEKADIPSPAGHPAIIETQPHLLHHPLFASTHYDNNHDDDDEEGRHEQQLAHPPSDVSPCSSSSSSPSPPSPEPPTPGAAAIEAEKQELGSFLFFDSPSSRSSRRPSTRDSSAPGTALSMPPLHRGPPPRRRHTRAGGAARSRRGSGSSMGGGVGGSGASMARIARPPTPPPPLPARSAARSKSLHNAKRPAAWI